MRNKLLSILLKAAGTLALALAFVALVTRVPFLPQDAGESGPAHPDQAGSPAAPGTGAPALLTGQGGVTGSFDGTFGLFRGSFSDPSAGTGFSMEEHRVAGACAEAGRRYLERSCPSCQVLPGAPGSSGPPMLTWVDDRGEEPMMRAVSRDCISMAADGVPVVATLRIGNDLADLTQAKPDPKVRLVPLLPGATRIAALELGSWLAIFDQVGRPSTALADMAAALTGRGWRETSGAEAQSLPAFEGERVFTRNDDTFCVISLRKQGDTYQLLTVVSSSARG